MLTEDAKKLSRREVRYRLFRIMNGNPVDVEDGIKKHYEAEDCFQGWQNFAISWDIGREEEDPEGHWSAHIIDVSLYWEHNLTSAKASRQKDAVLSKTIKGGDWLWQFLKK